LMAALSRGSNGTNQMYRYIFGLGPLAFGLWSMSDMLQLVVDS
jgi:hypothetical protein